MGKTTAVHKLQNTLWERSTTTRIHRGNGLLSSSSPHAVVTIEATTSHTHSLSLSRCLCTHALYNLLTTKTTTLHNVLCPKSYLYIYDFWVIYTCVPSNQSDGSEPGLRSSGSPKLPSGGTCFPTNSPFTPAWDFALIRSASSMLPACRVSVPWSACLTHSQSCGSSSARTLVLLLAPGSSDTCTGYASSWSGTPRSSQDG